MPAGASKMYLENIAEAVLDAKKIVTYKWLSRTLSVSTNVAKQMLYEFWNQHRDDKEDAVTAVYLVSGMHDNGTMGCKLAKDKNLEDTKGSFAKVTGVHIYSLQAALPKDISGALYAADISLQKEQLGFSNKFSAIKCSTIYRKQEYIAQEAAEAVDEPMEPIVHHRPQVKRSSSSSSSSKTKVRKTTSASDFFGKAKSKTKPSTTKKPSFSADASSKASKVGQDKPSKAKEQATTQEQASTKEPSKNEGSPAKQTADDREQATEHKPKRIKRVIDSSDDEDEFDEVPAAQPAKSKSSGSVGSSKRDVKPKPEAKHHGSANVSKQKTPKEEYPGQASKSSEVNKANESGATRHKKSVKSSKKESSDKKEAEPTPSESTKENSPDEDNIDELVPKTRTVRKRVEKTYMNDKGYMVTDLVDEEVEVELTAEEIEAEKQRLLRKRQQKTAAEGKGSTGAVGSHSSKSKMGKPKQATLMSFFSKKSK